MLISPSLLAADFAALGAEVRRVGTADMLHVDIMDGNFVPNLSIGPAVVRAIRGCTDLMFDVHLMLRHPLRFIEAFATAGADRIAVHPECGDDPAAAIAEIKRCGKEAAMAISPKTAVEVLRPYGKELSKVTVMSVEPGFGGQSMIPETLLKIREIKAMFPHILVEVDGGVSRETAPLCVAAGADILVAGTAVFGAADPRAEIAFFQALGEASAAGVEKESK